MNARYASEKAGVGGSTPSLATIIPKNLAESRLALPVRSQSAIFRRDPVRFLATMMGKDLTSNCLSLSPLSVRFCLRPGWKLPSALPLLQPCDPRWHCGY